MRLVCLFVSSLGSFFAAHGQSFSADKAEWQYPEFRLEPKFRYPHYAQQSNSKNHPPPRAAARDTNCPGNDNHALMCRLVNQYRDEHGLKPVRLEYEVTREAQYWS